MDFTNYERSSWLSALAHVVMERTADDCSHCPDCASIPRDRITGEWPLCAFCFQWHENGGLDFFRDWFMDLTHTFGFGGAR